MEAIPGRPLNRFPARGSAFGVVALTCVAAVLVTGRGRERAPAAPNVTAVAPQPPISQTAPASDAEEADDTCKDSETLRVGGDLWTFRAIQSPDVQHVEYGLHVSRNGCRVLVMGIDRLGGPGFGVRRLKLNRPYPVVAVNVLPSCGHPTATHLFAIRQGRLVYMARLGGENHGPLLRDYDGDGRPEWAFDNFCWYVHYSKGPTHYLIYKEAGGVLRLWKRVRARDRKELPDRIGIVCV